LASRNGGSNEVEAVMAKVKFLVTAAMALIGYWTALVPLFVETGMEFHTIVGSVTGHWAARRMQLSRLPS
jgi:hypothetical protein